MNRNFTNWLEAQELKRSGGPAPVRGSPIPEVLGTGDLQVLLQPIIDLETGCTFAYEALVRSTSPKFQGPPSLFADAIESELCGALGRAIREMAIEACPHDPLFLNIHPNEFDEGWLVQPDDPIFRHEHDVFLEITESVPLSHFELCSSVLQEIRGKGVYLAVDDLGAGYSNLKYISDLAPEIVKLDRNLVANLHLDDRLRRLVHAIVRLSVDLGAEVVAEGLERPDEVIAVREAGAHFGQGYVFARPSFPPPVFKSEELAKLPPVEGSGEWERGAVASHGSSATRSRSGRKICR